MSDPVVGIVKLYSVFISQMDGDIDFTGSVYAGPRIVSCFANLAADYERAKTPQHPNLLVALVELKYLRVRNDEGDPHFHDLFVAVLDKIRNKTLIKEFFKDKIKAIDDPRDPALDGITTRQPYIGVQSRFRSPNQSFSSQREEDLLFNVWIYQQGYPKSTEQNVIGE